MESSDYKCPACTAPLLYNPVTGSWKCEYCSNDYKLEDLKKNEEEFSDLDSTETIDVDEYTCSSCGAKIVTNENTTATFCVYCGNTSIIKNRLTGMLKPKYVIPFKTTKAQAESAFLKFKKGKMFAPKLFGQKEQIEKVTGVYIPFWLYDCKVDGTIEGTGLKIRTWRSGNYRYTKTDTYRVMRSGTANFIRVPVDGATKFDDDVMDSIEPFDYTEIKDFTPAYLSGFLAEKYDVDSKTAYKRAQVRMENAIKDYLKGTIFGYTPFTSSSEIVNKDLHSTQYVLFPVWMLNVKYKDKYHMFAMNGQTGKMVGNVPISWSKFFLWLLGLTVGIFILIVGIILIGTTL